MIFRGGFAWVFILGAIDTKAGDQETQASIEFVLLTLAEMRGIVRCPREDFMQQTQPG